MKRALSLVVLTFLASASSVRPARAGILDWMQEWSGPGPFKGYVSALGTICPREFSYTEHPCVFIDVVRFSADANDNFPVKVVAKFNDFGASWRLRRTIAIGVGAGYMRATGTASATRATLTLPRIVIEPVGLAVELYSGRGSFRDAAFWKNKSPWLHFVKFQARGNYILGRLTGDDLGVKGTSYDRKNEYVLSRGLILDFGELIPLFQH